LSARNFYEKAGLVLVGGKNKKLLTKDELKNIVSDMFSEYGGGCVLIQEAKLFLERRGLTEEQGIVVIIFAEKVGMIKSGCDDLKVYVERLKKINQYENQLIKLRALGYAEEDGFVEVIAPYRNIGVDAGDLLENT